MSFDLMGSGGVGVFFLMHLFLIYSGNFRFVGFLLSVECVFICVLFTLTMSKLEGCFSVLVFLSALILMESAVGLSMLVSLNRFFFKGQKMNNIP